MIKVYVPVANGVQDQENTGLSPKLSELTGKRIALFSNKKANAAEVLLKAGELLKENHGIQEYILFEKENASFPAPKELIEQIVSERYDAAVVSLGD
nr:hypothetical protein [Bacillus dakarensis]